MESSFLVIRLVANKEIVQEKTVAENSDVV